MSPQEIGEALARPFEVDEVEFKPGAVTKDGTKALPMVYITARAVMDRLDEVFGVGGWQDRYTVLPDGSVECALACLVEGQWVTKTDVGGESDQPDRGDKRKAAYSDALKRAAVKWSIGRYLYRVDLPWCPYDKQKNQWVRVPQMPDWALPPRGRTLPAAAAKAPPALPAQTGQSAANGHAKLPANGEELLVRLLDYETKLRSEGLCAEGQLLSHVAQAGDKAGLGLDIKAWGKPGIDLAAKEVKAFEAKLRKARQPQALTPAAAPGGPYADKR